jgi:serine/threonine protein kinase/Tol biopolymer transport system component
MNPGDGQLSGDSVLGSSTQAIVSPGALLGPYKLEAKLGAGGMGEVYRATDTRLHRTVAIKVLPHDKVADPERKRRFLQEARAASALNHPNIVTLHDIASDNGIDYLVMEYVPGQSLDQLIDSKGLPPAEAIGYTAQIANALAAAHAVGIVHRDIKPANVIVMQEAQVKILDFGLAKLTDRTPGREGETRTVESALTEAGTVMGTVAYMSPEQASARPTDHRTDIFSLGVVLYEAVAGQKPFRRKSQVETLSAIINEPAPPLVNQPPELQEIVDKALAKDPKDRYQHAGDFALDLRRFQRAWKSKSLPSLRGRAPTAPKGRMGWVIGAAVLAIGIALAGWLVRSRPASSDNPLANATFTRLTDFEGSELAAEISPDGKFVAFISDRDGPFDLFVSRIGSGRFLNRTQGKEGEVLENTRSTGFSGDGSEVWLRGGPNPANFMMRSMPLIDGPPRPFLQAVAASWSPDGNRMVFHRSTPGDPIFVADRAGGDPKQIFVDPNPGWHCHYPVWSPDGKWIYFVRGNFATYEMDLWRISPSGGQPERMTHHNNNVAFPAPIDDHTILYVSPAEDGSGPWLYSLNADSKTSRRVLVGLEQYLSVAASTDGRRVVATVANPSASLWKVPISDRPAGEDQVQPYVLPNVRALAPRLRGTSLFFLSSLSGGDGLWRYRDNQALELWKGSDGPLLAPAAISGDGKRVAITVRRQGKIRLTLMGDDGSNLTSLAESLDARGSATWSPDGQWIAIGGEDGMGPGLFKIPADGGPPVRLTKTVSTNPVWSPDSSLIFYGGPPTSRYQQLRAVRPDGTPVELPDIRVRSEGERFRLLPDGKGLVYMDGLQRRMDFALLDLTTMKTRPLTHLNDRAAMRTFDITPDGKQIVFDRLRENSDIVLIDLPGGPSKP